MGLGCNLAKLGLDHGPGQPLDGGPGIPFQVMLWELCAGCGLKFFNLSYALMSTTSLSSGCVVKPLTLRTGLIKTTGYATKFISRANN